MRVKTCPVSIKKAGEHEGTDEGTFEAIVATYDLDSGGDKIAPGAFNDSLDAWKASGDPIPVLWSHMSHDPEYHIGYVEDAEERDEGLWVKARLDVNEPKASKVYKLLKGRRITQFSFAYDVEDGSLVEGKDDDESYYELRRLRLYEVGPTLIGMNQATSLLDVKRAGAVKEGRRNAKADADTIQAIHDAALSLGATCDTDTDEETDEPKATPARPPDVPRRAAARDEDAPPSPAFLSLLSDLARLEGQASMMERNT